MPLEKACSSIYPESSLSALIDSVIIIELPVLDKKRWKYPQGNAYNFGMSVGRGPSREIQWPPIYTDTGSWIGKCTCDRPGKTVRRAGAHWRLKGEYTVGEQDVEGDAKKDHPAADLGEKADSG